MTLVPYPYWNLKLRDDSNILDIASSIALDSSGRLFSELISASRTKQSAVSPINTGIVFIDIAILFSFYCICLQRYHFFRNYTRKSGKKLILIIHLLHKVFVICSSSSNPWRTSYCRSYPKQLIHQLLRLLGIAALDVPHQVKRGRGSFRRISYNLLLKQVRMSTSRDHQHNEYIIILLPY